MARSTASAGPGGGAPFYGRPYPWVWFGIAMFAVPAVAFALRSDAPWNELHPALNAMLNATSGVFLAVGYVAIRRRKRELHRACMLTAFTTSSVFLVSYLIRYATSGAHRYPGTGIDKIAYLVILFSHMVLAAALVPLVLYSLRYALKGQLAKHRRVARWTWPIWMYVSVTGVVVYLMLYPLARALYG